MASVLMDATWLPAPPPFLLLAPLPYVKDKRRLEALLGAQDGPRWSEVESVSE